jgi:protease-4
MKRSCRFAPPTAPLAAPVIAPSAAPPVRAPTSARLFQRPIATQIAARALAVCGFAAALWATTPLHAQPPAAPVAFYDQPSPTRGLLIPGGAIAGDADATSLTLNPGLLGFARGTQGAFLYNNWGDDTAQPGRGIGGLLTLSPADALTFGLGYEHLRPSFVGAPVSYGKLSLGLGLGLGPLAIGGTWEHLFTDRYAGLDTASFGLALRPHDRVALGLVLRDAFRPHVDDVAGGRKLPRELDLEIAVRPTGSPRIEIAGGARALFDDDDTRFLPHARLSLGLVRGLTLFADAEQSRTYRVDARDFRFGVGLLISGPQASYAGAGVGTWQTDQDGIAGAAASGADEGLRSGGGSLVVRITSQRQQALFARSQFARVRLDGLESDRSFLSTMVGLRRVADDPGVRGIVVQIDDLQTGYGRIEELRQLLLEIGQRKPLVAWLSNAGTAEYYLASACHKVAIHPAGGVFLSGMTQSVTFWKGAMERLGVAVELVRIAEYKGAMEPFVMTEQSQPVRENRLALLDDLFGRLVDGLGRGRRGSGLDASAMRGLIDRGMFSAAEAKDRGLVDGIAATDDEFEKFTESALGARIRIRDADFRATDQRRWRPRKVAVIMVDGPINDGKPQGFSPNTAGIAWADPIVDALTAVRRDSSIRAVVLRVNSPGGSAFASDRIYREVKRLREAKPVIVSMGDNAASGGYYVAAPANLIIASPATVTGSIGIFAYKVDVSGLASKLSINTEVHTRGAHAALYSPFSPWSEEERATVHTRIEQSYKQFINLVADGRKSRGIDATRADQLGRGRVYTGAQALKLGLVDRLGSFSDAVTEAAQQGGVPTGSGGLPELVVLPRPAKDPLATLLALREIVGNTPLGNTPRSDTDEFEAPASASSTSAESMLGVSAASAATLIGRQSGALYRLLMPVLLGKGSGIEARLPYELEFR